MCKMYKKKYLNFKLKSRKGFDVIMIEVIVIFSITIVFSSCTMEKRIYMPGYHISMKSSKQNREKQELTKNESKIEQSEKVITEKTNFESNTIENNEPIVENLSASADNEQIIVPKKEKINLLSNYKKNINFKSNIIIFAKFASEKISYSFYNLNSADY